MARLRSNMMILAAKHGELTGIAVVVSPGRIVFFDQLKCMKSEQTIGNSTKN